MQVNPLVASQARNFVFTLNNPTVVEVTEIAKVIGPLINYLCYGFECGEKGTVHLQGYLECVRQSRFAAIHKIPGCERFSLEPRYGTQEQAIKYTQKDGEWYEYGIKKQLQETTQKSNLKQERLKVMKTMIEAGATEDQLFDHDALITVQHEKWIEKQMLKRKRIRMEELKVLLYYGPPGCGKTRRAYEQYPDLYTLPIGKDLWFDNYREEKDVLIDDFSGNMSLVNTLRLLDRYPIMVPKKGGFVWWYPTNIIITTNVHPQNWYNYSERRDSEEALKRRIHGILDFSQQNPITKQNYVCKQTKEFWL